MPGGVAIIHDPADAQRARALEMASGERFFARLGFDSASKIQFGASIVCVIVWSKHAAAKALAMRPSEASLLFCFDDASIPAALSAVRRIDGTSEDAAAALQAVATAIDDAHIAEQSQRAAAISARKAVSRRFVAIAFWGLVAFGLLLLLAEAVQASWGMLGL
jgi:hypothetical protein